MTALFDNPMGLCGFEFVEFASPIGGVLEPLFEKMTAILVFVAARLDDPKISYYAGALSGLPTVWSQATGPGGWASTRIVQSTK